MAQGDSGLDLILAVDSRSSGRRQLGARAAAGHRRSRAPRRRSAEEGHPSVPMADSGRGLAREQARGTRDLLGLLARGCSGRNGARGGGGGTAAANSPVSRHSDT